MLIYFQMIDSTENWLKFEQIYTTYRPLMFRIANDILHNEQDAEDTVHSAFIKIAENIARVGEPLCPKTKSYVVIIVADCNKNLYWERLFVE